MNIYKWQRDRWFIIVLLGMCIWNSASCTEGRDFIASASQYKTRYNLQLGLGECVIIGDQSRKQDLVISGIHHFLDYPESNVDFSRMDSSLNSFERTQGGAEVGVSFLGLVGASVDNTVTVNVHKTKNVISMSSKVNVKRGFHSLKYPQVPAEVSRFPDRCPYYVSEIEYGADDEMIVEMEFETEDKKLEMETTIKIKILFIKISKKMRYTKTSSKGRGKTKVIWKSSYNVIGSTQSFSFGKNDIDLALAKVEEIEAKMFNLPQRTNSVPLDQIHLKYFFAKPHIGTASSASAIGYFWFLERAKEQYNDLKDTLQEIEKDFAFRRHMTDVTKAALKSLRTDIETKKNLLWSEIIRFPTLTRPEILAIFDIFGRERAPGYYMRQYRKLLEPRKYLVCEHLVGRSTGNTETHDGWSLEICSDECDGNRDCAAFSHIDDPLQCVLHLSRTICEVPLNRRNAHYVRNTRSVCQMHANPLCTLKYFPA